jgi:hypothetical protein
MTPAPVEFTVIVVLVVLLLESRTFTVTTRSRPASPKSMKTNQPQCSWPAIRIPYLVNFGISASLKPKV